MKVFISQPFNGKSYSEIINTRAEAIRKLHDDGYQDIEIVDNYTKEHVPERAGRLWYLGDSIKLMDGCDLIVFAGEWYNAKGCLAEFKIAKLYNLKWITMD